MIFTCQNLQVLVGKVVYNINETVRVVFCVEPTETKIFDLKSSRVLTAFKESFF